MTLSAIDNPYGLIGEDSMDADKSAKKSALNTNGDLFSRLLSTTGVQQVAYTGSNDEFDETLNMQDQTIAHEARMGEDSLKYEGLGLVEGDAAVIESTRSPRELKGQQNGTADGDVQKGLYQQRDTGNRENNSETGEANVSNTAELLALGAQNRVSAVDEIRSANAAAARSASDVRLMNPSPQVSQATASQAHTKPIETVPAELAPRTTTAQAQAKPVEMITAEEPPKSRYASGQPQSSNGSNTSNQQKANFQVTKIQEDMMSQPSSTLSAGIALVAQVDKSAKPITQTLSVPAEDLDGEVRPPLANFGNVGRSLKPQPAQNQPSQPQATNAGLTPPPQPAPLPMPTQSTPQTQMPTATSARADIIFQTGQPIADPITGGPTGNNNGQQAQRNQQTEAPRPARPPVLPQDVTNQVAIQIKKAIGQGSDQIRIQLKPAELGRVEVKLEVTEDGRAMAVVSAERSETLDLMQRDVAGLRQALQDAGLNTDSKSLTFNLQGEGSKFENEMADRSNAPLNSDEQAADAKDADELSEEESALLSAEAAASDGRVNVQV